MRTVFADTGYWIALFQREDTLHAKAIAVSQTLKRTRIVTSQMVLAEFLNHFAKFGPQSRKLAVLAVEKLHQDTASSVVQQTSERFTAALSFYSQREDKRWGFTDCSSFLVMQEQNITEALAHGVHFKQAGFITPLNDS